MEFQLFKIPIDAIYRGKPLLMMMYFGFFASNYGENIKNSKTWLLGTSCTYVLPFTIILVIFDSAEMVRSAVFRTLNF